MISTLQSENQRLRAEVQQLNEQVETLLRIVEGHALEIARQRELIHHAQHLIQQCPYCEREWGRNLVE